MSPGLVSQKNTIRPGMKGSFNSRQARGEGEGRGGGSTAYKLWGLPQVLCDQLLLPPELYRNSSTVGGSKSVA